MSGSHVRPGLWRRGIAPLGAVLLALAVVGGCSGGTGSSSSATRDVAGGRAAGSPADGAGGGSADRRVASVPGAPDAGSGGSKQGGSSAVDLATAVQDRREIVTAQLTVRTRDVTAARAAVRRAAATAKGVVSDERTTTEGGRTQSELTVRVPVPALDGVMDRIAATGTALERSRSSQDVTGTYVDTSSRVRSQRASVERLRALLARATTIGQVVQVESELARREADLEALEAQLQRLDDQTTLATLIVSLVPPDPAPPVRAAGFIGGLRAGWEALAATVSVALVVLGAALPFAVVVAVLAVPAAVLVRRRRRTAATPAA